MRECSTATAALLANPPPGLLSADLFTFTLADGATVYRWTSFDRDLTVNGAVYSSRAPWLSRSRWSIANTMQVPTLEVFLRALSGGFSGGIDIKGQITNGLFDGAAATLDRVWFPAGTNVINDIVYAASGAPLAVVDVNAITNASGTDAGGLLVGITVSGFDPTATLFLTLPPNLTYTAEYYTQVPFKWSHRFKVIPDGDTARSVLFDSLTYDTAEQARAAFPGGTITGGSSYCFYIVDGVPSDNAGGLSIQIAGSAGHPGVRLFGGNVGDIDITGNEATINVKGKVNQLNQYAPRNLYQLGCEHAFCDVGCTLVRATFTTSYTVGSSPTRTLIPWSGSPPGNASNYRFGTVAMTSGPCAGQRRTVRAADSTGLTLIHPLTGTPVAGDGFTAFEGCDKAKASSSGQDCTARSNTQNWRAFPFVPPADTAF